MAHLIMGDGPYSFNKQYGSKVHKSEKSGMGQCFHYSSLFDSYQGNLGKGFSCLIVSNLKVHGVSLTQD